MSISLQISRKWLWNDKNCIFAQTLETYYCLWPLIFSKLCRKWLFINLKLSEGRRRNQDKFYCFIAKSCLGNRNAFPKQLFAEICKSFGQLVNKCQVSFGEGLGKISECYIRAIFLKFVFDNTIAVFDFFIIKNVTKVHLFH